MCGRGSAGTCDGVRSDYEYKMFECGGGVCDGVRFVVARKVCVNVVVVCVMV